MTQRPRMDVTSVTVGAPDPRALAAFYARLLGWPVTVEEPPRPGNPPEDGWAQVRPPDGAAGPTLNFEYETHYTRPVWPAEAGKQHITEHLDINVGDLDAAVAWAVEAGATLAGYQPQEDVRVLFDPAGHPFCLFT
jgi:catechol 2,3-dioxygenase-like lactoylglutathione lyase family enzyme